MSMTTATAYTAGRWSQFYETDSIHIDKLLYYLFIDYSMENL
jgi:hypothetical protein